MTSTNTGFAPAVTIDPTVATNVYGTVITSSPGPIFKAFKDNKFITRSIKHNIFYATKIKNFLSKYDIISNKVSANFLLLDFIKCKFSAKYFYEKLKLKGIILRSTENGYKIKNMLRLTIGSKIDNLKFMNAVESIFRQ